MSLEIKTADLTRNNENLKKYCVEFGIGACLGTYAGFDATYISLGMSLGTMATFGFGFGIAFTIDDLIRHKDLKDISKQRAIEFGAGTIGYAIGYAWGSVLQKIN